MTSSQKIRKKQKKYIFDAVKNYYKEPIVVSEAKGSIVKDLDGKSYLDFFGGILTVSIGHANEEVNSAVIAQISNLTHISSLYPSIPVVELAERLVNLAPKNLNKVFLNATGTEADETAVMLAQLYTGNTEILALRHGYSGRSMLAQSLTAHAPWRAIPTQIASVKHAMAPYCYRCPLKLSPKNCGTACATDVEELIQTTTTGKIAGILVEPIMGVGGFITPPKEYFSIVADIVRKYGGIFISDEVQTGVGRTGENFFAIEDSGIVPDMIINPHAIPTRMTINQLLEVILGKSSCIGGYYGDCTPFQNTNIEDFFKLLEKYNYEKQGNEVLYSGITAEQMKTSIFIGPTYYQRMKIMVADKMYSRATGSNSQITNQPISGRSSGGGLRIGEMERDGILGHGTANFLQESMMKRSD